MERVWITAFLFICFGHNFAWAENQKNYLVKGKDIELRPPAGTTGITGIIWKHNEDLVAEWSTGDSNVEYYSTFNGRSVLDTATGILVISSATGTDAGVYTVEINNKLLGDKYEFALVEEVPKPRLWVRPGSGENVRTLDCDGQVEKAGPVEFLWDITEDGSWVKLDRIITLENNETTRRIEEFSCKMRNPAGEKTSEPEKNPFYEKPGNPALGALALIPIAIVAAVVGVGYWKRDPIRKLFCPQEAPPGNGAAVAPEAHPLNQP